MAILRTPLRGKKLPSYGARVVIRVSRGRAIFQKWPRKRGKSRNPITIDQNELFKERNKLAKYAPGEDQWMAITIAKNSPLYPRDLLMSAMAGRLFETLVVDGKVFTSVAVRDDISADLDLIGGKIEGSMLVRGPTIWQALFPGDAGQVLVSQGPGLEPRFLPEGGQIGASTERSATLFLVGATTHPVPWEAAAFDDTGLWNIANPTRLTMPNEAGRVTLSAGLVSTGNIGGTKVIAIRRNGTDFICQFNKEGTGQLGMTIAKGPIAFAPNDYFEVTVFASFAFTLDAVEGSFFAAQLSIPAPAAAPVDPHYPSVVLLPPFTTVIDDDASISDHTLSGVGNAAIVGGALDLDGNGDAVSAPDSPDWDYGSGDLTLDIFVDSRTDKTNSVMLATAPSNGAGGWIFEFGSTNGVALWANGAFRIATGAGHVILAADALAHVALTREGNILRLWHNGFQIGIDTVYAGNIDTSAIAGIRIGNYTNEAAFGIDGTVQGVRITKGVARYNGTFTPPTLPLPTS